MLNEQLNRIEDKVDQLANDLKLYSERTIKVESDLSWIKRISSVIITAVLTACGWLYTKSGQ